MISFHKYIDSAFILTFGKNRASANKIIKIFNHLLSHEHEFFQVIILGLLYVKHFDSNAQDLFKLKRAWSRLVFIVRHF